MDKYALFTGQNYYAAGGANDFCDSGNDLNGLIKVATSYNKDGIDSDEWWHIVDVTRFEIVTGSEAQAYGACDLEGDQIYTKDSPILSKDEDQFEKELQLSRSIIINDMNIPKSMYYSREWAECVSLVNKHKSISECFVEPQNINECVRFTQRIKAEYSDASDLDSFLST